MTTNGQVPPARNQFNMYEKIDAELSTHVAKIKYILELQDSLFTANNDREMFRIQRDNVVKERDRVCELLDHEKMQSGDLFKTVEARVAERDEANKNLAWAKKRIDALEFQRDARSVEHADKVAQLVDDLNAARSQISAQREIITKQAEAHEVLRKELADYVQFSRDRECVIDATRTERDEAIKQRQRCINIVRAYACLYSTSADFQRTIEGNEVDAKINDERRDTAIEILQAIEKE